MYENSKPEFFRTTTGIQSGPDVFDKSKLIMTFILNFNVTITLRNFRLVLEEKAGKEIPESSRLEFLQKFSVNKFYN